MATSTPDPTMLPQVESEALIGGEDEESITILMDDNNPPHEPGLLATDPLGAPPEATEAAGAAIVQHTPDRGAPGAADPDPHDVLAQRAPELLEAVVRHTPDPAPPDPAPPEAIAPGPHPAIAPSPYDAPAQSPYDALVQGLYTAPVQRVTPAQGVAPAQGPHATVARSTLDQSVRDALVRERQALADARAPVVHEPASSGGTIVPPPREVTPPVVRTPPIHAVHDLGGGLSPLSAFLLGMLLTSLFFAAMFTTIFVVLIL